MVGCHGCYGMKKILYYYFIFSLVLGTSIYLASKFEFPLPKFVRFYVNDFLIVPIVLTISLVAVRKIKKDKTLVISLPNILYLSLFYTVFFEFWLPKFHPRYTFDVVDIVLYFLSGLLFYTLQKENNRR